MSPGIAEIPQDILLELAKELDVGDLLAFLSICRVIRRVQLHRTLWLNAIARIKAVENHPLPVPNGEAFEALSLGELQDIVRRAHRLMNNFKSAHPRPVAFRTLCETVVGPGYRGIIFLQGTNLLVIHDRACGSVACWDIPTSQRLAYAEIPNLRIETEACMEIQGKALLGGFIWRDVGEPGIVRLAAIYIDYKDRTHISISHVTSPPTNSSYLFRGPLFVNSRMLGFCSSSSLVSWCIDAGVNVKSVAEEFISRADSVSCLPFGQGLYLFSGGSLDADAAVQFSYLLPTSDEHSEENHFLPYTIELPLSYSFASNQRELLSLNVRTMSFPPARLFPPDYGVFASTCRDFPWKGRHTSVVHFWPGNATPGEPIDIGQGHFHEHVGPIYATAVGASGRYMLILVRRGDFQYSEYSEDAYLGLLHFSPTSTPHITFRKLDTGEWSPGSGEWIAFDDALGLVSVIDTMGRVTVISYV
ncbi:hypothetical protein B0H19DRAFT_1141520 [Mycena capillaripes]|nr:hypothetical protein B0H19DRAFT_1141520 [Mycena capillaripes]